MDAADPASGLGLGDAAVHAVFPSSSGRSFSLMIRPRELVSVAVAGPLLEWGGAWLGARRGAGGGRAGCLTIRKLGVLISSDALPSQSAGDMAAEAAAAVMTDATNFDDDASARGERKRRKQQDGGSRRQRGKVWRESRQAAQHNHMSSPSSSPLSL